MPAAASDADEDNGDGEKDVHKVRRRCASLLLVAAQPVLDSQQQHRSCAMVCIHGTGCTPWLRTSLWGVGMSS